MAILDGNWLKRRTTAKSLLMLFSSLSHNAASPCIDSWTWAPGFWATLTVRSVCSP